MEQSFWYFTGRMMAAADYGIKLWEDSDFRTVQREWGLEGHCLLRKP